MLEVSNITTVNNPHHVITEWKKLSAKLKKNQIEKQKMTKLCAFLFEN